MSLVIASSALNGAVVLLALLVIAAPVVGVVIFYRRRTRPTPDPSEASAGWRDVHTPHPSWTRPIGAGGVIVIVLAVLYFNGTFDRPLSSVGLNFHKCARNGFGATFCGKELKDYQRRVNQTEQQLNQAQQELDQEQQQLNTPACDPGGTVTPYDPTDDC